MFLQNNAEFQGNNEKGIKRFLFISFISFLTTSIKDSLLTNPISRV